MNLFLYWTNKSNMEPTHIDISIEILSQLSPDCEKIIKQINKKIKSSGDNSGSVLNKKLEKNNFILLLSNIKTKEIVSFIWYGIYFNDNFGDFLHVNFSYTFVKFRNRSYNKLLRVQLEKIGLDNNIQYITSTPFDNSPSKKILINLGYSNDLNNPDNPKCFYKKLF